MRKEISLLACLVLCLCFIQVASAAGNYEVDSIEVVPTGDIAGGESVTVRCTISFTGSGDYTFPTDHYLELYTDLTDFSWTYSILVDGHGEEVDAGGRRYLRLDGWSLAYPEDTEVTIDVLLEGKAPEVTTTTDKVIFRIQQIDDEGDVVSKSEYTVERTIINPEDIQTTIDAKEADLSELRSSIDARYAEGVNTASAEEKFNAAKDSILKAKTSPPATAQSHLTNADTYISEAKSVLEQEWTQKIIDDTTYKIGQVDDYVTYFRVERKMDNDARVLSIASQLDNANTLLTLAKDKQSSGEYSSARIQANSALEKADEAFNASVALKEEIGEGGFGINLGGSFIYIVAFLLLAAVAVIGYVVYKRRYQWDELG